MKKLKAEAEKMFTDTLTPAEKLAEELAKINELLEKGLIDQTTADRAIAKAGVESLGKHPHEKDFKTASAVFGSKEALETIFAAQRTADNKVEDKLLKNSDRQLELVEDDAEIQKEIAANTAKFADVQFIAGVV